MRRSSFIFLAIVSALAATRALDAARPRYGGTLRIETRGTLRTLDPAALTTDPLEAAARRALLPLVFDNLTLVDGNSRLAASLATSWESDAGARRWQFRLARAVSLHDGSTLEPAHVAASLRSTLPGDAQVHADGDAVVVELRREDPDFPWLLADARHAIAVRRGNGEWLGTGPFRAERLETNRVRLTAHDGYWLGRPFVDAVEIAMGRSIANQLSSLEAGRADIVAVQPTDARRALQRQWQVVTSRPLELLALVFEAHRVNAANDALRAVLDSAIDRDSLARVLLQGQAAPAVALLPRWLSGYAPLWSGRPDTAPRRRTSTALPSDRRAITLRVDASDPLAQSVAERVAVDAREAGIAIRVQAPTGLAARPDIRVVRIGLHATTPDRALASTMTSLGARTLALTGVTSPPSSGASPEQVYRLERALLERGIIIPIVHVPHLYALAERVQAWQGPAVRPSGAWNLANVWLAADALTAQ